MNAHKFLGTVLTNALRIFVVIITIMTIIYWVSKIR